jgi:23S rRNA (cytidine1920-2'-O)/16S rRNA (cytidine1409-2'-O)-methyltransferase
MSRQRLDVALEARGLIASRARARDAILRGTVSVNGAPAVKPGQLVGETDDVFLDDPASGYVSRAALKLIAGLDAARIDVTGRVCLDIGASTGGFTQVLLERGAAQVFAIDVGHGQLHASLRGDPRVVAMDGVNARDLTASVINKPIDVLTSDLSFVSVTKVLETPLSLCRPGAAAVILVKPQFEVGRRALGKSGIVTDEAAIERAVANVRDWIVAAGWRATATLPSPIAGSDGNREVVTCFRKLD